MQTTSDLDRNNQFLVFLLDDVKYGVRIDDVHSVVRAVEVTPVPESDAFMLGLINLHGTIVPIVNIRLRFSLPGKSVRASDHMIILQAGVRLFGIIVDEVRGYFDARDISDGESIWQGMEFVEVVVKSADGMILINPVTRLFPEENAENFEAAISGRVAGTA